MNETSLASGTGGLTLNWFDILSKSALYQRGPRFHPSGTPRSTSTTCKPPPSDVNRGFEGSCAFRFGASLTIKGAISYSLCPYILLKVLPASYEREVQPSSKRNVAVNAMVSTPPETAVPYSPQGWK